MTCACVYIVVVVVVCSGTIADDGSATEKRARAIAINARASRIILYY